MSKILVAYVTMAGSTAEVAKVVGEVLAGFGYAVDVLPAEEVKSLQGYDGVVVGGPMIMGWHRGGVRFLKKHRGEFSRIPLAVFITAMSLTLTEPMTIEGVPVRVDELLPKPPQDEARLSFRERYARLSHYLEPILRSVHPVKPASLGVFGGRLDYGRLKWWAVLFAMLIIQAPAGERRNWPVIREWAASLPEAFGLTTGSNV